MQCPEQEKLEAIVTGFAPDHSFGYAKTNDPDYPKVTFSLMSPVWSGSGAPQKGEVIIIEGVSKFPQGWRALQARRFVPLDEA